MAAAAAAAGGSGGAAGAASGSAMGMSQGLSGAGGAMGGGIMGLAGGLISSALQEDANLKLQKRAQDFALKMTLKQYPMLVHSLRDAGLNPMLAIGNAGQYTGGAGIPSSGLPNIDLVGGSAKGQETWERMKGMDRRLEILEHEAATAMHNRHSAASIAKINEEGEVKAVYDAFTAAEIQRKTAAERVLKELEIPKAARDAGVYKGDWGGFIQYMRRIGEAISPFK